MILVSVGTEQFPFNRLMNWINDLIEEGFLRPDEEEIVIQYGACQFVPHGVKGYSILPQSEFHACLEKARLIIAHCGEGTIDLLAKFSKPFILVPRSVNFKEHVDDHQIELAEILEKRGVNVAYAPGDLVRFLTQPTSVQIPITPEQYYFQACQVLEQKLLEKKTQQYSPQFANVFESFAKKLFGRKSVYPTQFTYE